jgi:hypothetical protein
VIRAAIYLFRRFLEHLPAFARHVLHVCCSISQKQMVGIHAWGSIATMKNPLTVWNDATMQNPRGAVRLYDFPEHPEVSVIAVVQRTNPQPTAAWRSDHHLRIESRQII